MGRPPKVAGGLRVVVSVRLSEAEAADLDARRGSLARAEFLRYLMIRARREDLRMSNPNLARPRKE